MPLNEGARNDIMPWAPAADETTGDLMPLEEYEEDLQRKKGFSSGLARRAIFNRSKRQVAHMAAGLAQFLANRYAAGIIDDADLDKVEAALLAVISGIAERSAGEVGDALATHAGQTQVHSATSGKTANRIIIRDAAGRAKVADPAADDDIATKGSAATAAASLADEVGDALNAHAGQTQVHSATSGKTANRIIIRDAAGRAKVADPAADDDIANLVSVLAAIADKVPGYAGYGLLYDPVTGKISVDFSTMPTDKFEALLGQLRLPLWLEANTHFFVRPDGDDSNDGRGSSAARAWKSIQGGLNNISTNYNLNSFNAILNIAAGEYEEKITLPKFSGSTGQIYIQGAGTETILKGGFGAVNSAGSYAVRNLLMRNQGISDSGVASERFFNIPQGCYLNVSNVYIEATTPLTTASSTIIFTCSGGSLYVSGSCNITMSDEARVYYVFDGSGGLLTMARNITINGVLKSHFVRMSGLSRFNRGSTAEPTPVITGAVTGGSKYYIYENSICNTKGGGADFFPGDNAGIIGSGGQYI